MFKPSRGLTSESSLFLLAVASPKGTEERENKLNENMGKYWYRALTKEKIWMTST